MNYLEKIKSASDFIKNNSTHIPSVGMVLGSGLGSLADQINNAEKFNYADIPYFPTSTVEGHAGQLVLGDLGGKKVVAMQGRIHFYEGYTMREITFPIRVMKALGIETIFVTSACGAMNKKLYPGALMLVTDHINMMGDNPLIGDHFDELGPRFPDMSKAYSKELIALGKKCGKAIGVETTEGVHAAISGPYFFSKAELKMIQILGADTIGMSMIPEIIVAAHGGLKALGIACITDMAVPDEVHEEPTTHAQVMEVANRIRPKFIKLLTKILEEL